MYHDKNVEEVLQWYLKSRMVWQISSEEYFTETFKWNEKVTLKCLLTAKEIFPCFQFHTLRVSVKQAYFYSIKK